MEYGCPLCNGLTKLNITCPKCGEGYMEDKGQLEDFYGPYSPYDNNDLYDSPALWNKNILEPCIHLFSCEKCGYDHRLGFRKVKM